MIEKKRYSLTILKASILGMLAFSSIGPSFGQVISPMSSVNTPYDEQHPVISPLEGLFFTVAFHPMNQAGNKDPGDIWMSVKTEVLDYGIPVQVEELSTSGYDVAVGFPNDHTILVYHDGKGKPQGIHEYVKAGNSWKYDKQLNIGSFRNQSSNFSGRLSSSGDVLILSLASFGSFGNEDIYVSFLKKDGNWSPPQNLGPQINTYQQELTPYLSEDKRLLFFSANGHGSVQGWDIFYVERLNDSWEEWTKPIPLPKGNTIGAELTYFHLPGDPQKAIFTTTQNSEGYGDLLMVQAEQIERMVSEPTEVDDRKVTEADAFPMWEEPVTPDPIPLAIEAVPTEQVVASQSPIIENAPQVPLSRDSLLNEGPTVPIPKHPTESVPAGKGLSLEVLDINSLEPINYSVAVFDSLGARSTLMKNTVYQNTFPIDPALIREVTFTSLGYLPLSLKSDALINRGEPIFMSPATKGVSTVLEDVHFKRGTAELLDKGSTAFIWGLAEFLQENPHIRILLEGHTDNLGNVQLNKELSLDRASAIRGLLVQQGIEFQRIRIAGWGGTKPIASNQTEEGRGKNRRVEMVIVD